MHPRLTTGELDTMIQGITKAAEKVRDSGK